MDLAKLEAWASETVTQAYIWWVLEMTLIRYRIVIEKYRSKTDWR